MTEDTASGVSLTKLERMEMEEQVAATKRKLRRDPWATLLALVVAGAVQYPIFGPGLGLAISCSVLAVFIVAFGLRDRRRTKRLLAEMQRLLEPGETR